MPASRAGHTRRSATPLPRLPMALPASAQASASSRPPLEIRRRDLFRCRPRPEQFRYSPTPSFRAGGLAMADELDSDLTGAAFDLANAGYKAMPDRAEKDQ